ncbi:MAG TPA: hypothetical protein VMG31_15080 [Verrucomicrobiae bacterium]|nr:hypothetical protein [Verrucomicrobiae bacterium]
MTGQVFNSGTINSLSASMSPTTAMLSIAPTYPGPMTGGWLTVLGTASDGIATHAHGATISSTGVSGTTVNLTKWQGTSVCSGSGALCSFQIGYNLQNAIEVVDEQCAITSISNASGTTTIVLSSAANCSLSNGEFVTVFGTGSNYNSVNRGPISVTGCTGSGACSFSYSDTTTGTASTGSISLKSQHIFIRKNHVHHTVGDAIYTGTITSSSVPPAETASDLVFEENYVHDCGTSCITATRASHVSFSNNTVFSSAGGGSSGACYNFQQAIAPRVIGNQCTANNAAAVALHGVFLYGGVLGASNDLHDVIVSNQVSTDINLHCDTCVGTAIIGNTIGDPEALPGSTQPVSGGPGIRVEVGKGVAVTGNSVYNVGGPGIFFNSRLENSGSNSNATASCVASGCTTPSGHQLWSADDQLVHNNVSFTSSGNSKSVVFNVQAITTTGTNTAYNDSTAGQYVEGSGSQKICPNSGCTSASFAAGTIFYVNVPCSSGGNCLGSNAMNLLTLPVWRFAIGSPTTIQPGDFQLCLSSQANLVAPESCTDLPQILASKLEYLEIIPANWPQTFDNPGVQSFGLVAKAGNTTGSYTNIWVDDFSVDVPGRMASIVVSGNTVYRSQGAGIATSGGSSRFAITGNTILDPGWDTAGNTTGGSYGIDVDNGLTGSSLVLGTPLVGGAVEGNNITSTPNTTSASATCIKLNVVNSGSIDQVRVGTANLCSSIDWPSYLILQRRPTMVRN